MKETRIHSTDKRNRTENYGTKKKSDVHEIRTLFINDAQQTMLGKKHIYSVYCMK
jgi:hypothetical protein